MVFSWSLNCEAKSSWYRNFGTVGKAQLAKSLSYRTIASCGDDLFLTFHARQKAVGTETSVQLAKRSWQRASATARLHRVAMIYS